MKTCVLFIVLFSLTSCAKNVVTNTPPGVTSAQVSSWMNATNDLAQAQNLTHAALGTVVTLNHATPQVIPDGPGYTTALTAIGHADQIEIEAAQFLKAVPNDWSQPTKTKITDYVTQILAQLAAANATGVLGVKDPSTGLAVTQTILNIMKIVNTIQTIAVNYNPTTEVALVN